MIGLPPTDQKNHENQTINAQQEKSKPASEQRKFLSSLLIALFGVMWFWIGSVSALDTYFIVKFRSTLHETEENPVGRLLLELDGWDVSLFVGTKMLGTIMVLGVLALLYGWDRRFAFTITGVLCVMQGLLLFYILS